MECNNQFNSYCNHTIMILYYPVVDTQSPMYYVSTGVST